MREPKNIRSSLETETAPPRREGIVGTRASSSTSSSSSTNSSNRGEASARQHLARDDDSLLIRTVTTEDDGDETTWPTTQQEQRLELPLSLQVLFGCNGVTLALPTTALMYIVNTRIAVPLSVLPAYASVAFLPFSLKPLYAVANQILAPPSSRRRHVLLGVLLLLNSATLLGTYWARDVPSCFVWAFLRGATSAWAEFLLGLALLSRVGGGRNRRRRQGAQGEVEVGTNGTPTTDGDDDRDAASASFLASRFQAQAAAARSVGSLSSYVFTAVYFGLAELVGNAESRAVGESDVWNLLAAAAAVHVAGSALALSARVGGSDAPSKRGADEPPPPDGMRAGCLGRAQALLQAAVGEARLSGSRGGNPSYHRVGAGLEFDRPGDRNGDAHVEEEEVTTIESERQPLEAATTTSSFSIAATLMIGSLQVALVLMTVRQPIVGATSAGTWWCGFVACAVALLGSGMHYYSVRGVGVGGGGGAAFSRPRRSPDATSCHRVGLFLLLRHSVPSCTYLVESYVYTLLQEHPVVLQVLAVHGSAMTTVAAWSYGRFGASFSIHTNAQPSPRDDPGRAHPHHHCRAVVPVIVITTVAASLISLTQLSYLYCVVPPPMVSIVVPQLGVIFIVKSLTTVAGEWKFLPDVVLATLAAVEDDDDAALSSEMGSRDADAISDCSLPRRDGASNANAHASLERDVKYGSLISCIDFGGQLGSLLTGPLIAILHVTRDGAQGQWVHFDRLIIVGALLSVMSLFLLLILPGVNLSTIFRVRLPSSS